MREKKSPWKESREREIYKREGERKRERDKRERERYIDLIAHPQLKHHN